MRYFTVKEGALVSRFGTGTYLGAAVSIHETGPLKGQTKIVWTGEVVALTDEDFRLYGREYEQLKDEGSLIETDEKAYNESNAKRDAETKAEKEQSIEEQAQAKAEAAKAEADLLAAELAAMQERAAQAKAEAELAEKNLAKLRAAPTDPAPAAPAEPASVVADKNAAEQAKPKSPAHARSKE